MTCLWIFIGLILLGALGALAYWLIVITEGVYLGRRAVVWNDTTGRPHFLYNADPIKGLA